MFFNRLLVSMLACGSLSSLHADFTYNSTSQMTGGSLLKMMSFVGGKLKEPIASTTSVKGNVMVHKTGTGAQVIDLDKETITHINYDKKTYSVATFAETKQAMQNAMDKAKSKSDVSADFKVSTKETGQTKSINGHDAKEFLVTIEMTAASTEQKGSGSMQVNSDMWMASGIAGADELRDFQMRMAQKIDWMPTGSSAMGRPDFSKGITEAYKEAAKMNGLPILQVIKMNGQFNGAPPAGDNSSSGDKPAASQSPTSPSDAIASALGGRFGLGKKKTPPADNSGNPPASNSGSSSDSLIEMTQTINSFSNSAADPSLFEIPAGFKLVKEDPMGTGRSR